jgi:hypothetical protein
LSSPNDPAISAAGGLKMKLMGRANPNSRIARLTCQRRKRRLNSRAPPHP